MTNRAPAALSGWRIDRRSFLKAMGLGGIGLVAGAALGTRLAPLVTPVAAQTSAIDDLALLLQFDPERIFRFVADEIRYQPYAGLLRGPEGTLMARAGNSADQAALLAALLRASGVQTRYVVASIDDMAASSILGTSISDRATASRELVEAVTGIGEGGRPVTPSEPDPTTTSGMDTSAAAAQSVVAWTRSEFDDTIALIQATLAAGGITLPSTVSDMPPLERRGHAWVRMAAGPAWIDLDPSLPGATVGDSVAMPTSEHDELPDDLRHRITFEVIGETVTGGSLQEEGLLEVDLYADALAGLPIGLMNIQRDGLMALGADIAAGLEGGTSYLPCLMVGEDVVVGPGQLRFGGTSPDPFGVIAAETPEPQEGEPTAEWAQLTIRSPGAEPVAVRREIFDRIGPAARAGGVPDLGTLAPAQLTDAEPGAAPDFLPALRTHWLTVHPGTLGGEALGRAFTPTVTEAALAGVVHAYHFMREAAGAELGLASGIRPFVDAPNVVALTVDLEQGADGTLSLRTALDIWHRSFGSTLVSDAALEAPPQLASGVLAHLAERVLAGEASGDPTASRVVSVGAVFDRAIQDGIGVRLVRSPEDAVGLPFAPDVLQRLGAALAGGRVAVLPERAVRFGEKDRVGWWVVDPTTGAAIDQMDDGTGSAMADQGTLLMNTLRMVRPMRDLGLCVGFAVLFSSLLLSSVAAVGAGYVAGGGLGAMAMAYGVVGSAVGGGSGGALAGGLIAC